MGMAREEYDVDSASSQWFWLLFDSDLTPAGKNLLNGPNPNRNPNPNPDPNQPQPNLLDGPNPSIP